MDQRDEYLREQFLTSLRQLVDQGSQMLGESGVLGVLEEMVGELGGTVVPGGAQAEVDADADVAVERRCYFGEKRGEPVLTMSYPSPQALEADLETLTQVRGLMVELSRTPPLMESVSIDVKVEGSSKSVELKGRAVHASNEGVALELFPQQEDKRKELEVLVVESGGESDSFSEATVVAPKTDSPIAQDDGERIPGIDRLVERPDELAHRWSLRGENMEAMLLEAATIEGYGFLEFECSDAVRQYVLHYGKLIDVRSEPREDQETRLIEQLKSTGYIGDEDLERAKVLAAIHGIPQQDALVDMGCITLEDLLSAIKGCLVDDLQRIWELDAEEGRLYLLQHRPHLPLRRSSVELAEQVVRRIQIKLGRLSRGELQAQMERFSGARIARIRSPIVEWARFGFDADSLRFLEVVLDKGRSLSEVERISNLRREDTRRMLLVLDELDLLTRTDRKSRLPEHYEIEGLFQRIQNADHFEVLGVHWSAYGEEIERAYSQMCSTLEVPRKVESDLADELAELRRAAEEAYQLLCDTRRRREYRNQRFDRFARTSVLEVYEKKADSLRMRGEGEDLVDCLQRILELHPSHRRARAELKLLRGEG